MKLLAIDTATEACSAALLIDSDITQKFEVAPRKHAELILTMIDQLLIDAGIKLEQLDGIAFGCGPGAFTGIRIAAGIAQGLAFATGLPVVPVSNLAALAQSLNTKEEYIFSAIDARMQEIYWCIFSSDLDGKITPVTDEVVSLPSSVIIPKIELSTMAAVGTGWKTYGSILTEVIGVPISFIDTEALPEAKHILQLARLDFESGNYIDSESIKPVYLRNNVTG